MSASTRCISGWSTSFSPKTRRWRAWWMASARPARISPEEATAQSSLVSVTMSMMVFTPAPGSPTISPIALTNSTSDEALERLPSLSFSRWKRKPLPVPSPRMRGTRKARQPLAGLRQHQERIRHRRRHEPFVAGQAVEAAAGALGPGGVGADIGAALLLGHAHAERQPGLLDRRLLALVVFARRDARRPFAKQLRARHQRGERRAGHGDRAEMPGLELRRQVEARRPHLMPPAGLGCAIFPDRGVQPVRHRAAHQRVIGGMEFDRVDAPALPVMGPQHRRLGVGEARQVLRLMRQHEAAEIVEILAHRGGKLLGDLDQQRIAAPGIAACNRRRLVGYLVRHALSFVLSPQSAPRIRSAVSALYSRRRDRPRDENPGEKRFNPKRMSCEDADVRL